jgi:hypothetical protein
MLKKNIYLNNKKLILIYLKNGINNIRCTKKCNKTIKLRFFSKIQVLPNLMKYHFDYYLNLLHY